MKTIHPPIDRVLLEALYKHSEGQIKERLKSLRKTSWSKFDESEYDLAIDTIRDIIPSGKGLWVIEAYWQGYQ